MPCLHFYDRLAEGQVFVRPGVVVDSSLGTAGVSGYGRVSAKLATIS